MLKGVTEPRVWTKPLRELTPETSLGFLFADFCADICELPLLPWQRWLGIHGLEIIGSLDGDWHFRFRTIIVLVARQNGKSKFLALLSLFFMFVLGVRLVLGTAQNLDTANEVWEDAVEIAMAQAELSESVKATLRGAGQRLMKLEGGERYKVVSANRSGGRGNSADLVNMDELREQRDWAAWGAVTKTTMARPNAQVWCFSNAGDPTSIVLRSMRIKAHGLIGDPDGIARSIGELVPTEDVDESTLALFEWSAPPGCDIRDKAAWAQANPSLGYGFMTERALASAASTDPEPVFRTECLCQWVETVIESAFPDGAWDSGIDPDSFIAEDAPLSYGIDVSTSRDSATLAVCGKRPDGKWHVEVIARKEGFSWLEDWLRVQCSQGIEMHVAFQGRGAPITSHVDDLERIENLVLHPCEGKDMGAWTGRFYDAVAANVGGDAVPLKHVRQPALDHAAHIAQTKPVGEAWVWNRTASVDDISPLVACTMAFGLATANTKEQGRVYESAYATRGLVVI